MYTNKNIEAFIPANNKEFLKESIISILNQTIGTIDITVMDTSCSGDIEVMVNQLSNEYPNVHHYKLSGNVSQLELTKKIADIAQKDFTLIFNGGDILHPDYLKYAIDAINKYPNTSVVSSCYQEWSNPTNENWAKASQRFDYCTDKKMFVNYLYRMQRYSHSNTVYKTQNLKEHIYNTEYYAQFGRIGNKPLIANTMKDNDGAIIFRSKKFLRYRVSLEKNNQNCGPSYGEIIAYSRFAKQYMQDCLYSKFMFNIINYKQLRVAYVWGRDFTLSLEEFIQKAIDEDAGCEWTKLCIIPVVGKLFIEAAHILRKFFKTKYKRVFYL